MSSSCHGGGVGRDAGHLYFKKNDRHTRAHGLLISARSAQIAAALKIEDATKSARCTVCHSPQHALPPDRFAKGVLPEVGVSCESCHGPAEPWLRFHTRKDLTHGQRIASGLRDLEDFYHRSNACIACHLNIDPELVVAGHPEMFFELDGQVLAQPPHWVDKGSWLGPRAWLTGQAAALRELSWKATNQNNDPSLAARARALTWLLRQTDEGAALPEGDNFGAIQNASDRLARAAARQQWSKDRTKTLLRKYASLGREFREAKLEVLELGRRAEVLQMAIDRLWAALKKEGGMSSDNLDKALIALTQNARSGGFNSAPFAAALEQIEVALELGAKG